MWGVWIPVAVYIVFLLYPWLHPSSYIVSELVHCVILCLAYQLSVLCLVYVIIETFRRYQAKPGRLWNELNRNSYYVYIIHVIVTGGVALIMLNTAIPSLWKYLVLTVSTFVASNLIISGCRKVIDLKMQTSLPAGRARAARRSRGSRSSASTVPGATERWQPICHWAMPRPPR